MSDPLDALHDECAEEDTSDYSAMNAPRKKAPRFAPSRPTGLLLLAFTTSIAVSRVGTNTG